MIDLLLAFYKKNKTLPSVNVILYKCLFVVAAVVAVIYELVPKIQNLTYGTYVCVQVYSVIVVACYLPI